MNTPTAPDATGEEKPIIETIAKFAQPVAHLNKLGVRVPGEYAISVKRKNGRSKVWGAYWHEQGRPLLNPSGEELRSEFFLSLKTEVESYFEARLTPWIEFTEK